MKKPAPLETLLIVSFCVLVALAARSVALRSTPATTLNLPSFIPGYHVIDQNHRPDIDPHPNSSHRIYQAKYARFDVITSHSDRLSNSVHDPRYCAIGKGWKVKSDEIFSIPGGQARSLIVEKAGEQTRLLYWYNDGKSAYTSFLTYKIKLLLHRLHLSQAPSRFYLVQSSTTDDRSWESFALNAVPWL